MPKAKLKIKQPLKAWLTLAPPDEIIAEIRKRIRVALDDTTENDTKIIARNGYYFITFGSFPSKMDPERLLDWTVKTNGKAVGLRRRNLEPFFKDLRRIGK